MKVLSIKEPFASLIKEKKKCIETRSWKTSYRGELYIHASLKEISKKDERVQNLLSLIPGVKMEYGNIICKCNLVDCVYMDDDFLKKIKENNQEYICGDYGPNRYAWILEDVTKITPIKAKGRLNIWEYKEE